MKVILSTFLLLSLLACSGGKSSSGSADRSTQPAESETLTTEFMRLVNEHRKSKGLGTITHSVSMSDIAFTHSQNMARKNVSFGHSGFSGRCSEARDAMGGGNLCAENVAQGQRTAQAVFNSWMNSSSHRANIENSRITHSGLGISTATDGSLYWTHLFLEL